MNHNQCKKCGGIMDMHYLLWCPTCDKPEPAMTPIYEFFKVARYIAQHEGYEWKDHKTSWVNKVLGDLDIPGNDCYIPFHVLDDEEEYDIYEHLHQFAAGLIKHFGIQDDTSIILCISW
jgi:hypothetical protein